MVEQERRAAERRLGRRAFLATGIGGLLTAMTGRRADGQGKEIVIGGVWPLSGPNALAGKGSLNGMTLAVQEINEAGGIRALGGTRLKLIAGDTQSKPEIGLSETERVIGAGAVAVVGTNESAVAFPATQQAEKYRVPFVALAGATEITRRGFKYTFQPYQTSDRLPRFTVDHLLKLGETTGVRPKTVVLLHEDSIYGQTLAKGVQAYVKEKNAPIEILADIAHPNNTTDLTSEVYRIKSLKPDVLVTTQYLNDGILLHRTVYEQRVELMGIVGNTNSAYVEEAFVKAVGKLAETVMNVSTLVSLTNPRVARVNARYEREYKAPMNIYSAHAYTYVYLVKAALEMAGSAERETLRDALSRISYDDQNMLLTQGPIQFDATGRNVNALSPLYQILDGKVSVVLPPEFAERKPVWPMPSYRARGL